MLQNEKVESLFLSVIIPALNEEKSVEQVILDTLRVFDALSLNAEIILVNDGSTDGTVDIVSGQIKNNPGRISMFQHSRPLGIGASFWNGVRNAKGDIVCLIPADNEIYPGEILRYVKLMQDVDMVIPFVINKEARCWFRRFLSSLFRFIINTTFSISLHYTNGTVIYRRCLLDELDYKSTSFFYQTDILIRLIKKRYLFAEVPYYLEKRREGKTKALSMRSLFGVTKEYLRLFFYIYNIFKHKCSPELNKNTASAKRYKIIR